MPAALASVTAIAIPRAPSPRCGVESGTVTSTMTSTMNRMTFTVGGTSIRLAEGSRLRRAAVLAPSAAGLAAVSAVVSTWHWFA